GDDVDISIVTTLLEPPPKDVVTWIRDHATELPGPKLAHGLENMAPIGKVVGGARVVAIGEATHGTHEFFVLKHRMLEYLVTERACPVLAIQASQPECRALNDYILHGVGNPRVWLGALFGWRWQTQEMLDLIEWMREWNAEPRHHNKVQLLGYDMRTTR